MKIGQLFSPFRMFVGSFVPNCLMEYTEITPTQKLLWARLAQYAGQDGRCFPQQKTLAKNVGISIPAVRKALYVLEEKGFIKIINPKGKKRLIHSNNEYVFPWHEIFDQKDTSGPIVDDRSGVIIDDRSIGDIVDDRSDKENPNKENPNKENLKISYLDTFPKKYKDNKKFSIAWKDWLQHRKEIKHSITPTTAKKQIKKIIQLPIQDAISMINNSIENGYTGLFPKKTNNSREKKPNDFKFGERPLYRETGKEEDPPLLPGEIEFTNYASDDEGEPTMRVGK